jgi:hypothetical protein
MLYQTGRTGPAASTGYGRLLNSDYFPDPFADYASFALPKSVEDVYDFCELVFLTNGLYREAVRRRVSYFSTAIKIDGASDDVEDDWKEFFEDHLHYRNLLQAINMDLEFYGNSYFSVIVDFDRVLVCGSCRQFSVTGERAESNPDFNLKINNYEHVLTCPRCGTRGPAITRDQDRTQPEALHVRRWSPREIGTVWHPVQDTASYFWKIPQYLKERVKQGDVGVVLRTPQRVLEAIKSDKHLLFDDDFILHLKEDTLAGIESRHWGVPRVLANFRQVWYIQVLHRYNEALALDYIIPLRLITPATTDGTGGADMLKNFNAAAFMANVQAMIRTRRRNPTQWNSLPFPVNYQVLGGEARQLAPEELLTNARESLLNDLGIPVELYRGSMTLQSAPVALRLFEATNSYIPYNSHRALKFIADRASRVLRWDAVTPRLEKVTHADDANRNISKLQLMTQGIISQTTGLKGMDIDLKDETRQKMEDQRIEAEETARLTEQFEQAGYMQQMQQAPPVGAAAPGQPGQPAPGGQPGQPAQAGQPMAPGGVGMGPGAVVDSIMSQRDPNVPTTPEEEFNRAQYLANNIAGMSDSQAQSELTHLKKIDPQTHAIVRSLLEDIKAEAKRQGGEQVMAARFGKAAKEARRILRRGSAGRPASLLHRLKLTEVE